MSDSMDQLSKLTKIPRAELLSIATRVKANLKALDECVGPHEFTIDATPDRQLGKKWRCVKCHGEVDEGIKQWYERGLEHGARR